ncbi:MAG: glycosyltransferase [Microgenomates group bacterium]
MLKAAIYDPYLDTLGGGERYCLSIAESLLIKGYQVDIFWSGDPDIIIQAQKRFNLQLDKVRLIPDIFNEHCQHLESVEDTTLIGTIASHHQPLTSLFQKISQFIHRYQITSQYDLLFYLSDWSIPFLFSHQNILHVQVPFIKSTHFREKFLNILKIFFIKKIICNSNFTQGFAQAKFGGKCLTLYPPVDVSQFSSSSSKQNIILSVGRFDSLLNSKKQDVLIRAFAKLIKQNKNSDWKLVLAGGSLSSPHSNSYLLHLQSLAKDLPVEFIINPDFTKLKSVYESAKIYWHAAGYEVDQASHPENTEHFGMAPVEAMASGAVPVLVHKGGLCEIISDNFDGYLWQDESELISKTQLLMATPQKWLEMSQKSINTSQKFSKESFNINFTNILKL